MARRHDRDAGGPAKLLAAKGALRERIWAKLADRPRAAQRDRANASGTKVATRGPLRDAAPAP